MDISNDNDISFTNLGSAYYGQFKVWHLMLFYMVGSAYPPKGLGRAIVIVDGDSFIVTGRGMDMEGILFELDFNRVKRVKQVAKESISLPIYPYIVAHLVSHALMKAVVRVSGLSYYGVGEAVYVDEDEG